MRWVFTIGCLVTALGLPLGASAQVAADPVAAAALFKEGREAVKQGDYSTACIKFADSYRLDPAPGTLLNLGDCNEKLGRIATAWQKFQLAAEKLPAGDERVAVATERIASLDKRLPKLMVTLSANAPLGTKVLRDDVELGTGSLGTALPVDPGDHVVIVKAPGRKERRWSVTLEESGTKALEVEPGEAEPSGGVPARPRDESRGSLRTGAYVAGGLGIAAIGVAIATGAVLSGKKDIIEKQCPMKTCNAEGWDAVQSAEVLLPVNSAAWIAGGVFAVTSVTLFAISRKPAMTPNMAIDLGVGPGRISIGGRF